MNDTVIKTISELMTQLDEKIDEIKQDARMMEILKLYKTIATLEELAELPVTSLAEVFGFANGNAAIRPDEFYGLSALEAAKRFIKKRGRACTLDEIQKGIQAGGCSDFRETDLRESLSRSTMSVAKVGNDLYGLLEFYPHIRRERKKRSPGDKTPAVEAKTEITTDEQTEEVKAAS